MSARGLYKKRPEGSLKQAEAALIDAAGGVGVKTRIGKTQLQQCSDADHKDRHLPADVILELERLAGGPVVTRYLALEQGYLVEPIPSPLCEPLAVVMGRITEETGQLLSAAAHDVQHNRLSRANAANVLRETDDLMLAMIELRAASRAVLEGRGP